MSYAARRRQGASILSMLDLLFGVFGAMIVLAALLVFLRTESPSEDQVPFVFAEFHIIGGPNVDVSRVYLDFELRNIENIGSQVLAPRKTGAKSGYFVGANGQISEANSLDLVSAKLFVEGNKFVGVSNAMLRPRLHNIADIVGDDDDFVTIIYALRTAHNACENQKNVTVGRLREAERQTGEGRSTNIRQSAPSPLSILVNSDGALCDDAENGLDFTTGIRDGTLDLNYKLPEKTSFGGGS
ncbi:MULTISPECIES: hypothetical protein [unclassified Ruegeria]|uniref:hypothetical protein n=1 Tax=unclassified Ruegeria TaxID=2625375 RepID=UPI00148803FB|nr:MULTISPECIES: hypothetical protein [unclassified Ruegeria]